MAEVFVVCGKAEGVGVQEAEDVGFAGSVVG